MREFWKAFRIVIPPNELKTIRMLNGTECRLYWAIVPGTIREPVFIVEGNGYEILMQLATVNGRLTLTLMDDFRNVTIRDR